MGIVVVVAWPTIYFVFFFFFVVVVVYYVASFGRRPTRCCFGDAKQKHLSLVSLRARANRYNNNEGKMSKKREGKNGKKKGFFFKFFHLGF